MVNTNIANYKIIRLIKSGGMADVYEGVDIDTAEKVAIKILKSDFANELDVVRRFYIEGAVLEQFKHPNIVKFIFNTEENGQPIMIMEYLEGYDMNELLNKKSVVDSNKIIEYFLKVLDAVIYAHSKNVVHRDIKPSNIFITNEGSVKLLDFGIAKILLDNVEQTRTGLGQFTPTYMSPEQAIMKRDINEKSDIYSLGITLFSLLNGSNPYQGMSSYEIGYKVIHEPLPSLNNFPQYNGLIAKATAKLPENRFATVADFKKELEISINKNESDEGKNFGDLNQVEDDLNKDMKNATMIFFSFVLILIIFSISIYFLSPNPTIEENTISNFEEVTPTHEMVSNNFRYSFYHDSNYLIKDVQKKCIWQIFSNGPLDFISARAKVNSINKIPSYSDMRSLFDPSNSAGTGFQKGSEFYPAHMDPIFSAIGSASWFWVSDRHSNPDKAYAINMFTGDKVVFDKKNPSFPVYLILKMDL